MLPYSWMKTEYANPGAENYAFVPNMTLPKHDFSGRGNPVIGVMRVMQSPQVIINHAVPMAGYGGLVAGQFISQPLS